MSYPERQYQIQVNRYRSLAKLRRQCIADVMDILGLDANQNIQAVYQKWLDAEREAERVYAEDAAFHDRTGW